MDASDPRAGLRISDDDRHRTAEVLREAAGEGRIDLDELDERLGLAYAAKTYAELGPLLADLPGHTLAVPPPGVLPAPSGQTGTPPSSIAILSEQSRRGCWRVGPVHAATAVLGTVRIDLREAVLTAPETVINANAIFGSVEVIVNANTRVVVEGTGVMGDFSEKRARVPDETGPGSPLVRVRGSAVLGSVEVVRKGPPGQTAARLRRGLGL